MMGVHAQMNISGVNAFQALFVSAVINGMLAPPLLVLLMLLAGRRSVMQARTNGWLLTGVGWATALTMFVAAVGLVITSFS